MVRERNPEFVAARSETRSTLDTLPEFIIDNELGFTKGITRDRYPQTIRVDDVDCYAKVKYIEEKDGGPLEKHFVKIGVSGFIYDPWGIYSEGTQAKDAKHLGRPAWVFTEVSKACFGNYVRYLMTRNRSYLLLAEREIRDA